VPRDVTTEIRRFGAFGLRLNFNCW